MGMMLAFEAIDIFSCLVINYNNCVLIQDFEFKKLSFNLSKLKIRLRRQMFY